MFGKRSMAVIMAFVITLVSVPALHAQSVPSSLPDTYQDTIKLFPADLQSGFFAMYTILSSAVSEKSALTSLHAYYLMHFLKENYITKGKGTEELDAQTLMSEYIQRRAALLANIGNLLPSVAFYGNPGGTNWDVWYARLMEWM